jgi:autotransporter-associated beta strand protein
MIAALGLFSAFLASAANATVYNWTGASGNWSSTASTAGWNGPYPSGSAATASFNTASLTVTMNVNATINVLQFHSATTIAASGANALTFDGSSPTLADYAGGTIACPIDLNQSLGSVYSENGAGLNITGVIANGVNGAEGMTLNISNTNYVSGVIELSAANTYSGVTYLTNSGTFELNNIDAIQNSTLDLGTNYTTVSFLAGGTYVFGGLQDSGNLNMGSKLIQIGNNNASTTYSGVMSSGTVTKIGTGMLTLLGANSFTGPTTISAGTLALVGAGSLNASSSISVASGAVLTCSPTGSSGSTVTVANTISGAGLMNLSAANSSNSTLVLSGSLAGFTGTANIYPFSGIGGGKVALTSTNYPSSSATINVENASGYGGTLYVNAGGTLASAINLYGGTTGETLGQLRVEGTTVSGPVTLFGNSTVGANTGNAGTISGKITQNGATYGLATQGGGTIVFTNTGNSYGGGTVVGGTLQLGNGGATGSVGAGPITINSGNMLAFKGNDSPTFGNAVNLLGSSDDYLQVVTGQLVTLSGSISNSAQLWANGSGTLVLTNSSNSFTGGLVVKNGTVEVASLSSGGGALSAAGTAGIYLGNNTASTLIYMGTSTSTSQIGQFAIQPASNSYNCVISIANSATNLTLSNALSTNNGGGQGFTKAGPSILTLTQSTATNPITGTVAITGGELVIGADSYLGTPGTAATANAIILNGGALSANNTFTLNANRGIGLGPTSGTLGGFGTIDVSAGTLTYGGAIASAGNTGANAFAMTSSGTLILTGSSTYTGSTTISGGVLQLGTGVSGQDGSIGSTSGIVDNAALVYDLFGSRTPNYSIGGSGSVTLSSGALTLAGSNSYSGATNVTGGVFLLKSGTLNSASAISVSSSATFGGSGSAGTATIGPGGSLQAGYSSTGSLSLAALAYAGSGNLDFGALSIANTNALLVVSSLNGLSTSGGSTVTINVASLSGTGNYDLISYNGAIQGSSGTAAFQLPAVLPNRAIGSLVNTGSQIDLSISALDYLHWTGTNSTAWDENTPNWILNSTSAATSYINNPGDTVVFDNSAGTNTSVSLSGTGSLTPTSVTVSGSNNFAFSGTGSIAGSTGLTVIGPGSLLLANTGNAYTGGTFIQGGTLFVGASNALPAAGMVTIGGSAGSATLDLFGNNQTIGGLAVAGSSAAAIITASTGSSTLTFINGGGSSAFYGTIQDTALTTGGTLSLTVGGGTLDVSGGTTTYYGATTVNGGELLAGSLPNTSGIAVNHGTLSLAGGYNTSALLTVGSGATAGIGGSGLTLSSSVTNSGYLSFSGTSGAITLGSLSGTGTTVFAAAANFPALSAGVVTIAGSATIASATGGTANLNGPVASIGTLSNPTVKLGAGTVLTISAGTQTAGGSISGAGSLTMAGPGLLTLGGNDTYSGFTTVSGGTLVLNSGLLASSTSSVSSGLVIGNGAAVLGTVNVLGNSPWVPVILNSGGLLTMSGTYNNQISTLTLNGGTLDSAGNFSPTYGSYLFRSGSVSVTANSTISATNMNLYLGSQTFNVSPGATLSVPGTFWGAGTGASGGLTLAGSGTMILSSSNSYVGATVVSGGTLVAANNAALGNNTAVTLSPAVSASLLFSAAAPAIGSLSSSSPGASSVVLAAGGVATTLTLGGNNSTTTYSGAIGDLTLMNSSAIGSLTKAGTGAFTLSGTDSYTGVFTVNAGTVNVYNNQSSATGGWYLSGSNLSNAATVNFEPGSTVAVAAGNQFIVGVASASSHDTQTLNVSGTVNNSGTFSASRGSSINLLTGGQWNQAGAMSLVGVGGYAAILTINPGSSFAYSGSSTIQMAPGGSNGSGYIYDNGLFTTDQAFQRSVNLGLGVNNAQFSMAGGTLQLSANVPQLLISSGTDTIAFVLSAGGGVFDTQGFSTTMSGAISGSGSLTKIGAGMLTLAGTNTYSGNTNVNGGTLQLGNAQALYGSINSTLVTANSGVVDLNSNSILVGGIGGDGGIITDSSLSGGTTTLTLNLFSNATYGGSLQNGPDTALALAQYGGGKLTLTGSSTLGGGLNDANGEALEIDGAVTTPTLITSTVSPLIGSGSIALTNSTSGLYYQSTAHSTFSGVVSGVGAVTVSTGILTLTASNTYTGGSRTSGGTLQLGNSNALGTGGLTANAGALDLNGQPFVSVPSLTGSSGIVTDNSAGTANVFTVNQAVSTTFGGVIQNGPTVAMGLHLAGSGSLTLNGANTYSGPTTITAGSLIAGAAGVLSPNSAVTLSGGLLNVTAAAQTIAALNITSGSLNLNLGNILNVTGTANLGGYLNLANLSSYSLSGSSIELMSYAGDSGGFSNSASFAGYYLTDTGTQLDLFKNIPTGTPTWSSSAGGSWASGSNWSTLAAPSSPGALAILGSALLSAGTVSLDSAQTVGSLSFMSSAGYTLTPGVSGNGSLLLSNTGGVPGMISVYGGSQSIAAPLTIAGTSTLIAISGSGSLGISGNILDGTSGTNASLTLSSSDGSGLLSLDGSNTFAGGVSVQSGTLILNGAASLAAGSSLVIGSAPSGSGMVLPSAVAFAPAAPADLAPVPEPGTSALLAAGVMLVAVCSVGFSPRKRAQAGATRSS